MDQKTDVVVVAFCDELRLLKLQARSFAKYASGESIGNIYIILHDNKVQEFTRYFKKHILPEYGHLKGKIKLTPYTSVLGHRLETPNWWTQQSIKILASSLVETAHYLILDCKNHLIRPLERSKLYTADNKMLMPLGHYHKDFDDKLQSAFKYFGGEGTPVLDKALPTITPFLIKKNIAQNIINHIETKEKKPFHEVFIEQKFTEFFLYFGYLLARYGSIDAFYAESGLIVLAYFDDCLHDTDKVDSFDTYINMETVYSLGVHRKVVDQADSRLKGRIAHHWKTYGLVSNEEEADYFSSMYSSEENPNRLGFLSNIKEFIARV